MRQEEDKMLVRARRIWTFALGLIYLSIQVTCTGLHALTANVAAPIACIPRDGKLHLGKREHDLRGQLA